MSVCFININYNVCAQIRDEYLEPSLTTLSLSFVCYSDWIVILIALHLQECPCHLLAAGQWTRAAQTNEISHTQCDGGFRANFGLNFVRSCGRFAQIFLEMQHYDASNKRVSIVVVVATVDLVTRYLPFKQQSINFAPQQGNYVAHINHTHRWPHLKDSADIADSTICTRFIKKCFTYAFNLPLVQFALLVAKEL